MATALSINKILISFIRSGTNHVDIFSINLNQNLFHELVSDCLTLTLICIKTRGPLVLYRSPECIGYVELEQAWEYMTMHFPIQKNQKGSNLTFMQNRSRSIQVAIVVILISRLPYCDINLNVSRFTSLKFRMSIYRCGNVLNRFDPVENLRSNPITSCTKTLP